MTYLRTPTHRATRPLLAAVAVTALAAVAAAGCGTSQAQKDANRYADTICTDISGWEQQIVVIAGNLDSGSARTIARTKLRRAQTVTLALQNQLRAVQPPDVKGAAEAKQNIDRFVTDSELIVDSSKAGAAQIQAGGTRTANLASVVLPIGVQLTRLAVEGKSTVASLKTVKGPFQSAVKHSDACKALKPS